MLNTTRDCFLCVLVWIGKAAQTFHSSGGTRDLSTAEVEVAEVREVRHAGEDRTGRKRTNGTFNNGMSSEMEMSADECGVLTLGKVQCCMNCAL